MTLRDVTYDGEKKGTAMVACPCGYEFDDDEERWQHIADHDPEDFGLSPLRSGQFTLERFSDEAEVSS